MSGSGGGGGTVDWESCDTLNVLTQLSSPKPDVIANIEVGDILEVSRDGTTVVVKHNGQIAGSITSPKTGKLRECLNEGYQYVAKVQDKNEGLVVVRVYVAPKP